MEIKTYQKSDGIRLSKHFALAEFACHGKGCCETVLVDPQLVVYLQQLRDHFGVPVHINSGYRCSKHNAAVGGAAYSYHVKGMAADIRVEAVAPVEVARYAESIGVLGVGLYEDFVHIDTRTVKSYWYGHGEEHRDTFSAGYVLTLPLLKQGSRGTAVTALQQLLSVNGFPCDADGIFGPATGEAVQAYQSRLGLAADGVVGRETMGTLLGAR